MEVLDIANNNKEVYINEKIRAKEVMVIGPNGEKLGIKPIKDALTLAEYAGFDLVLISPNANPQVCKIMDYNKYKYENASKRVNSRIEKTLDELNECEILLNNNVSEEMDRKELENSINTIQNENISLDEDNTTPNTENNNTNSL